VCPECGTPTERSPGGDPLSRADPQWLTRIAQGQALLAWGLLVAWLGAIMFGFMPVALHYIGEAGRGGNASWRMIEMAPVPVTGCVVMGMMMCTVGAFLLTTREPKKRGRETRSPARQLARQGMFATIGGVWLLLVVGLAPLTPGALNTIRVVLCPFSVVALIVAAGALLRFLAGLAARIPDRKLLRRTNKAMRPLCWAVAVLVGIVLLALWPASSRDLLAMVVWVAGAGCGVLIIVGLIIQQIARPHARVPARVSAVPGGGGGLGPPVIRPMGEIERRTGCRSRRGITMRYRRAPQSAGAMSSSSSAARSPAPRGSSGCSTITPASAAGAKGTSATWRDRSWSTRLRSTTSRIGPIWSWSPPRCSRSCAR
jgi:hypothetical protein